MSCIIANIRLHDLPPLANYAEAVDRPRLPCLHPCPFQMRIRGAHQFRPHRQSAHRDLAQGLVHLASQRRPNVLGLAIVSPIPWPEHRGWQRIDLLHPIALIV